MDITIHSVENIQKQNKVEWHSVENIQKQNKVEWHSVKNIQKQNKVEWHSADNIEWHSYPSVSLGMVERCAAVANPTALQELGKRCQDIIEAHLQ